VRCNELWLVRNVFIAAIYSRSAFHSSRGSGHAKRKMAAPPAIMQAEITRRSPMDSFSTKAAMMMPNNIEVSRRAATTATGARVIAHRANPYDAVVPIPPAIPNRQ
jgi:hypothetical protein